MFAATFGKGKRYDARDAQVQFVAEKVVDMPLVLLQLVLPTCLALHSSPQMLRHTRVTRSVAPARMIALDPPPTSASEELASLPLLSGLQGKAMLVEASDIPTKMEVRKAVPAHCFKRDTAKSMMYAVISVAQSAASLALARFIPMKWAAAPLWLAWAAVTGTVWTGMWVVAHECGHGAFSDNRKLQDAVGYFLHSLLLVPYFSWQRSHAVHHQHTNHITKGETHVPVVVNGRAGIENPGGETELQNARTFGKRKWGLLQLVLHLVIGWPAYLLWGATGGPKYGTSNHFVPVK